MDSDTKQWIDNATYKDLLERWRFTPLGDPLFQGETGSYFRKVMAEKKQQVGQAGHVAASKSIGWTQDNRRQANVTGFQGKGLDECTGKRP